MEDLCREMLTDYLCRKENIQALESAIETTRAHYASLLTRRPPRMSALTDEGIDALATQAFEDVCAFLRVRGIAKPPIRHIALSWLRDRARAPAMDFLVKALLPVSASYDWPPGRVTITSHYPPIALSELAHEQTHHVQHIIAPLMFRSRSVSEGHARGVQRAICTNCAAAHDNHAYILPVLSMALREMREAYMQAAPAISLRINQSILPRTVFDRLRDELHCPAASYWLGTGAFAIAEEKHGRDIYPLALRSDLSIFR